MFIPGSTSFRVLAGLFPRRTMLLPDVTIVTQYSLDKLHDVVPLADATDAPISVAVLAQKSIGVSIALIRRLRACFESVAAYVDFHLVIADGQSGLYSDLSFDIASLRVSLKQLVSAASGAFDGFSCELLRSAGLGTVFAVSGNFENKGIPYPHNMLRNTALDQVSTKHAIVIDGDFIPSAGFGASYMRAIERLSARGLNTSHLVVIAPGQTAVLCCMRAVVSLCCSL